MERPAWPAIRAALIAVVIAVNALTALPQPLRVGPEHFARPDTREEVDAWLEVLASAGVPVERETLERWTAAAINGWVGARTAVIGRPTRPLRTWLGIRQNWALFARPDTWPTQLVVEVDGPRGRWVEVYRSLHPTHDLLEPQLRYRRVRGVYDAGDRPAAAYENLTRWIAGEVFDAHPEARRVRVRLVRTHTTRPGVPADPSRKEIGSRTLDRAAVRP